MSEFDNKDKLQNYGCTDRFGNYNCHSNGYMDIHRDSGWQEMDKGFVTLYRIRTINNK